MAATTLLEGLRARNVDYELLPHPRTVSAAAEARVLDVPLEATAKTVILRTANGFARAVVPASRRIDLKRVARTLDDPSVELATEAELAGAYPEFELGAVPPFDGKLEDEVVVDAHLIGADHVVFEAGTHRESIRMRTEDLLELADARVAEVCERM
jgi:Ala-tRNA(Pro) deacylase